MIKICIIILDRFNYVYGISFRKTADAVAFASEISVKDIMNNAYRTSTKPFSTCMFSHNDLLLNNYYFFSNMLHC